MVRRLTSFDMVSHMHSSDLLKDFVPVMTPEKYLLLATLSRALADAFPDERHRYQKGARLERRKAIAWFMSKRKASRNAYTFHFVTDCLFRDPDTIREAIRDMISGDRPISIRIHTFGNSLPKRK